MANACGFYELTELIRQASDALFVSKVKFDMAISKKPRAMQRENNFKPQLYDGEMILLDGVNRALQTVNTALEKIKTVENWINSTERSKANYIAALKRRISLLQKSKVALKMTSTADKTSENTQNQCKRKDNGHPSKIKNFGTVEKPLTKTVVGKETFQPVTKRSQAPSTNKAKHDWPKGTGCAQSAKIKNKGFCSSENVFSDNDSSVLRAALATEMSHTNDEEKSLSAVQLDVTDAESLLLARKPKLLDSNESSDYQCARKQLDTASMKTQERDRKNSKCTPCVLEVSPPSSVIVGNSEMGEPAQKKIISCDPGTAVLGKTFAENKKTEINFKQLFGKQDDATELNPIEVTVQTESMTELLKRCSSTLTTIEKMNQSNFRKNEKTSTKQRKTASKKSEEREQKERR